MPGVTEQRSFRAGALVVGGDYQGLGIVRSLRRMGFPVCVVDDEPSIAGFSRYAARSIQVADLHDEETVIETLLAIGRRLRLEGWVVFATRDELVAALAKGRERLATFFRVPTPAWDTVRFAADKRLLGAPAARMMGPGMRFVSHSGPAGAAVARRIAETLR
jgi:predicted ATP-grasp superfamily ATP-dependent carboligase